MRQDPAREQRLISLYEAILDRTQGKPLDEDKTALTIDMTVEGQEKPLQLKVVTLTGDKAALGNDKGYYAASPSAVGELFEVAKELFDGPMSKPAYFIK